ncbi:DUF1150 family protein [Methyloferula stellata]|uniref:BQ00720 family protein n=1 Tax=Methyloferula stellata TaxID=876270 RepID=UPI00036CD162|nr:DUF1150 domain-containing protein [Methyloferula stellata]
MLDEQTQKPETAAPEVAVTEVPLTEAPEAEKLFTDEQFAHLGGGTLAYIKPMLSDEVKRIFPNAPAIDSGIKLFALLGADGTPLILSDSRDMAIANAREANLDLMSLQ